MTEAEAEEFAHRMAAVWASGDSDRFLTIWHGDGDLHHPMLDGPLKGRDIPRLHRLQVAAAPGLTWQLVDWTSRGEVLVVEWRCTWSAAGDAREWRGVDKLRLRDGRICEEHVYADTAPLRAAREGGVPEPMMRVGPIS